MMMDLPSNDDVNRCNTAGETPLHLACGSRFSSTAVIEHLIELGADPNTREFAHGMTPLMMIFVKGEEGEEGGGDGG
jgi:ankyrin repeat protein